MVGELEGATTLRKTNTGGCLDDDMARFLTEEVLRQVLTLEKWRKTETKRTKKNKQSQFTPQRGAIYLSQNKHFDVNFNDLYM